jgi:hypothetical protein
MSFTVSVAQRTLDSKSRMRELCMSGSVGALGAQASGATRPRSLLGWSIVSAEPAIPNATQDVSGSINLLLLPTGQFFGDESRDATNYPLV